MIASRRALIPNFTFEHDIAGRPAPRAARDQCERWKFILRLVPGFESAHPIGEVDAPDEVVAWGYTDEARRHAGAAAANWPCADAVRLANDKRTSHRLERELGVLLPGACVAITAADLDDALADIGGPWVAKHPFGVSGRDQVRGAPGDLVARERAARLLDEGFGLVVEPLVTIDREWSLHFDINAADDIAWRGATSPLTDRHGHFRGNLAPVSDLPRDVESAAHDAIRAIAGLGYRGPIGVDAHTGTLRGARITRPIGEIDARHTFGRLALWLSDSFGGRRVAWHHRSRRDASQPPDARCSLLPDTIDPGGRSGTCFEFVERSPSGA